MTGHDAICQTCPCAERDKLRAALERAREDILAIGRCGYDSTRRVALKIALDNIDAVCKLRPDDPEWVSGV